MLSSWYLKCVFSFFVADEFDFESKNCEGTPQEWDAEWDSFLSQCLFEEATSLIPLQQREPSPSAELGVPSLEELRAEIREYTSDKVAKSTPKKMNNSMKRFEEYVKNYGEKNPVLELDIEFIDDLLAVYVKSLKKPNGEDYKTINFQTYCACIHKYIAEHKEGTNAEKSFPVALVALASKKKELKGLEKGSFPNRAECLSDEQDEILWQTGGLGDSSLEILVNTMWFLATKLLGFRASHEARQLMWSDVTVRKLGSGDEYLEFNERWSKTRDGIKNGQSAFL